MVDGEQVTLPYEGDYEEGTEVLLEALPDKGYLFEKWLINAKEVLGPSTTVVINSDMNVIAYFFDAEEYTLSLDKKGRGAIKVDGGAVALPYEEEFTEGSAVELEAIPDSGWSFKEWEILHKLGKEILVVPDVTLIMEKDKAATAIFTPDSTPTVTAVPEPVAYGTVNGQDYFEREYLPGDLVELEAIPEEGSKFINWTGDVPGWLDNEASKLEFLADVDRDLIAHFTTPSTPTEDATVTITTEPLPAECGTTTGDGVYIVGTEVTLTAIPEDGCEFVNWTGAVPDGVNAELSTLVFNADIDRHLIANFTQSGTPTALVNDVFGEEQVRSP